MNKPRALVVLGPTGSGKTSLAIDLAKKHNGEIISADSQQVYAGMNIGTAKPTPAFSDITHSHMTADIVEGVSHYLFNIAKPDTPLSLSDWQSMAKEVLSDIVSRGKTPIIAGGTMLYIDSIVRNYTIPEVAPDPEYREGLEAQDTKTLYALLLEKDAPAQAFIEPHNKRRIIRALEVIKATGKPFSALRETKESPYEFELTGIFPGWEIMQERMQIRTEKMFADRLVEETQKLRDEFGDISLLHTMNYAQALDILNQEKNTAEAILEAVRVQMRYAHKQMSWWKGREEINWVNTK